MSVGCEVTSLSYSTVIVKYCFDPFFDNLSPFFIPVVLYLIALFLTVTISIPVTTASSVPLLVTSASYVIVSPGLN